MEMLPLDGNARAPATPCSAKRFTDHEFKQKLAKRMKLMDAPLLVTGGADRSEYSVSRDALEIRDFLRSLHLEHIARRSSSGDQDDNDCGTEAMDRMDAQPNLAEMSQLRHINEFLSSLHEEQVGRRSSFSSHPSPQTNHGVAVPSEVSGQFNDSLRLLHAERLVRRRTLEPCQMQCELAMGSGTSSGSRNHATPQLAMTNFSIGDLVSCRHGLGGCCLQCSGRVVENVPLELYSCFSQAYNASSAASSSSVWHLQDAASELSFPAFVSLAACLRPDSSERLLHLGSGTGRAVIAWALLFPQAQACGIEGSINLHRIAVRACSHLAVAIQQRTFLHHADMMSTQDDWCQASVILISAASFSDAALSKVVKCLGRAAPGTRVVSLLQPLAAASGQAPLGYTMVKESVYRTVGAANVTAYFYLKS